MQEILNNDETFIIEDAQRLFSVHPNASHETAISGIDNPGHPIHIFQQENKTFQLMIQQTHDLLNRLEKDPQNIQNANIIKELKRLTFRLGEFHKHYHRKEKLFSPLWNVMAITIRLESCGDGMIGFELCFKALKDKSPTCLISISNMFELCMTNLNKLLKR